MREDALVQFGSQTFELSPISKGGSPIPWRPDLSVWRGGIALIHEDDELIPWPTKPDGEAMRPEDV